MLLNLARLNHSIKQLGHPGLIVKAYDGDTVSESNVGRQCFYEPDIGKPKASTLIQRLNLCFGTKWEAKDEYYEGNYGQDMMIVAVDSAQSRETIHASINHTYNKHSQSDLVIMDLGNGSNFGQVLIGNFDGLPSPYEQLPDLIDSSTENPQLPSCSTEEALSRQELFVNSMGVTLASQLLWELFRKGMTRKAGFYFNMDSGKTIPVSVKSVRKSHPHLNNAA